MILRHEINLSNGVGGGGLSEISQLNTTVFSGTVTYYFEILVTGSSITTGDVRLRRTGTTTDDATITISSGTVSTATLFRTSFTPPSGSTQYTPTQISIANGTFKSARIIVIQDTGTNPLTASESQYEIGNRQTAITVTTTGTLQPLAAPKYWQYNAANFDGTCTFYGECTYLVSSTTGNKTLVVQESSDLSSWSTVATMLSAASGSVTAVRVRSSSFTPVDGRYYRFAWTNSSTMSTVSIYNAKIIVDQQQGGDASFQSGTSGFSLDGTTYGMGESFSGTGVVLTAASFYAYKIGAPTGNMVAKLYAHSGTFGSSGIPTGTALDTSTPIDVATLSTTSVNWFKFIFSGGVTLTNAVNYCIVIEYSNGDASNNVNLYCNDAGGYAGNRCVMNTVGTWTAFSSDAQFIINPTEITKTEDHYLLANTTLAAGTALQNFLTKWDSAEWSGVTNTYIHQVDSSASNTSVVEVDTAGGSQVSGSVVSSPNNYKVSSSMTMPANGNLDVKATTNSGNIFGSRIIVKSVKSTTPPATYTPYSFCFIV